MARQKKVPVSNKDIAKKLVKGLNISQKVYDKIMIFSEFKMRWYAEEVYNRYLAKEISQTEAINLLTTVQL